MKHGGSALNNPRMPPEEMKGIKLQEDIKYGPKLERIHRYWRCISLTLAPLNGNVD